MKPRWGQIEKEHPWLKTEMYDYDKDKEMVDKYMIDQNLPTFVFIDKEGEEFLRLQGEVPKKELIEVILKYKDR